MIKHQLELLVLAANSFLMLKYDSINVPSSSTWDVGLSQLCVSINKNGR